MAAFLLLSELILTVIVAYLIYEIAKHVAKFIRVLKYVSKLPGPKTTFPFGNILPLLKSKTKDFAEVAKMYVMEVLESKNSIIRLWLFHIPIIAVVKPVAAEQVLKSSTEIKKSEFYELLRPWLGDGLLLSSGAKWHSHRKLLTPSFHFKILENFIPIFNEQSQILVNILSEKAGQEKFELYPFLTRCTLDIICATAMGKCINAQTNPQCDYVKAVQTLTDNAVNRGLKPWLQVSWIYWFTSMRREDERCLKILHDFTEMVIKDRKKQYMEERISQNRQRSQDKMQFGIKNRVAFLDTLIEASENEENPLTLKELCEEVDTFMFEGHDTTASSLIWALVALGWLPEIQERVYEEIIQTCGSTNNPLSFKDVSGLKYLEAVIKESLRIFPTVPVYGRLMTNDTEIEGYVIPKGVEVFVFPYLLHHDKDQFKDPDKFRPERFIDDSERNRHSFSYVPFSAGPRNCIGQKFAILEEKIVLAHLIRQFSIRCVTKFEDIKPTIFIVGRPLSEVNFIFQKRI